MVEDAMALCRRLDKNFQSDPIFVSDLGGDVLGLFTDGKVLISQAALDAGIDILAGTLYEEFLANVKPVSRQLVPLRMTSLKGANFFPDQCIDSVFIDAAHDYENVKADIAAWLPKVKKGGVIAGHDYMCGWPGVDRAVAEAFNSVDFQQNCWLKVLT
jgi:hypothetical protein